MFNFGLLFLGFIFGACLGSFANVLADRSLEGISFKGRSQCPYCKKTLAWFDLVPVISYLTLGGKCRYCHKKISNQYLWAEVITGILGALIFYLASPSLIHYLSTNLNNINNVYPLF